MRRMSAATANQRNGWAKGLLLFSGLAALIEASHQRLVDFYDIAMLATVADREAWAAEEMASRVRDFQQLAEPNAYYGWFFSC